MQTTRPTTLVAAALFALLFAAGPALAQKAPPSSTAPAPQSTAPAASPSGSVAAANQEPSDQDLLFKMHQINQLEIRLGNMAKVKGTTAKVRTYGDRLVRDHQMADEMVLAYASSHNVPIERTGPPSAEEQRQAQQQENLTARLARAEGPTFDELYLKTMVDGHKEAIAMLRSDVQRMPTSQLRTMINHLLPILVQHEELAEHLTQREIAPT
jgi:putative membrane protein